MIVTIPGTPPLWRRARLTRGGSHYTDCKIQPIEYIWANNLGFSEGNIIKYVTRWRSKGGIKDLEKAKHHIALLIEHELAAANAAPRTSGL